MVNIVLPWTFWDALILDTHQTLLEYLLLCLIGSPPTIRQGGCRDYGIVSIFSVDTSSAIAITNTNIVYGNTPVDDPPLMAVEVCSIFEDNVISIIEIELPSTPTRKVQAAGAKRFSNSLAIDKKLLNNVESSDKRGINRVQPHFPLFICFVSAQRIT